MTSEAMRADLVNRVKNTVNALRHEWAAAGNPSDSFALEMAETPTGVSISLVVRVGVESSEKEVTPLSKKKI